MTSEILTGFLTGATLGTANFFVLYHALKKILIEEKSKAKWSLLLGLKMLFLLSLVAMCLWIFEMPILALFGGFIAAMVVTLTVVAFKSQNRVAEES